ncbi:MAG: DNA (cytosine-5-)-methyltransferase [Flavobacterium sp.]|nr:DNA (cytosine-5-)-methyltransferase [Flavobacterium sp.]
MNQKHFIEKLGFLPKENAQGIFVNKPYKFALENIKVVDLFCGIGGLSHGFVQENFDVVAGIDFDGSCKYAFEKNNAAKFISNSISEIHKDELNTLFDNADIRILVGCAPCQNFSSYMFKDKEKENDKWKLLYEFSRLINEVQPEIVSMENVAQLLNFKKAPVFEDFVSTLKTLGYHVNYEVIMCPDYGIPQNRKRLILLASKLGAIQLIPKTHSKENYVTVKDAIGNLPKIADGEKYKKDPFHFSRKLTPLNKKRIQATPYGGSWKDWDEGLKLTCHKKESGKSYPSVYGRMIWEKPSPTMTTHCIGYGNGRFGHPTQDRAISLREAALLQTFPINYQFAENVNAMNTTEIARQIGNAVPVKLGEVIAKSIKQHLKEYGYED